MQHKRARTTRRQLNLAKLNLAKLKFSKSQISPPFYNSIPSYSEGFHNRNYKYILLKGGRGGGKSFGSTAFLIEESFNVENKGSLFVFAREIQTSIDDSVYSLTKSLIHQAHLQKFFIIQKTKITNKVTGVTFVFIGLRATGGKTAFSQVNKIKGKFDVRYILVDEAQDLTDETINVLFPTINRGSNISVIEKSWHPPASENQFTSNSRLIFLMNPNFDHDPIVIKIQAILDNSTVKNAVIKHVNIFDIPEDFQDPQLIEQAKAEEGEIYYGHVWLGEAHHKISGYPWASLKQVNSNADIVCFAAFLDPSFKGGDETSISFLGKYGNELCVWGYSIKQAWNKEIDTIVGLLKRFQPANFHYEDNSLGTVPQDLFAEHGVNAYPHTSMGNKENRIYKVAGFLAHRTSLITNLCNSQYINGVMKYNEDSKYDDAPDSLASVMIKSGLISERMKF